MTERFTPVTRNADTREPAWEMETQARSKERREEEKDRESEISSMVKDTIKMLETAKHQNTFIGCQ